MTTTAQKPYALAEISEDGDRINVTFHSTDGTPGYYNPAFVKAAKRVPGASFRSKEKGGPLWRYPGLDLPTCRKLRESFGDDLRLGEKLKAWGQKAVRKETQLTDLSQADDADLDRVPARMVKGCKVNGKSFKLRPYQKADIKFMAESGRAICANQPGAGKTITTIASVFEAGLEWGQHLVFAPVAALRTVWEDQVTHAYSCAGYDEPTILTGDSPDERREAIEEAGKLAKDGKAFWLVLNPYAARLHRVKKGKGDAMKIEEELISPTLAEISWDSITIDEFHLMGLSNPTTLGARGVNQIADSTQPKLRFALSGTPMGGKPIKLWGALHFLEPEEFTSRWNWARHWLVINHNGYGHSIEGIMPGREEDFYNHLKPYLVRRTKREALPGLPPKQRIDVWCEMTPKQRDQYDRFETEAEWAIDDMEESGRLTATNVLSLYLRLKQFAFAFSEVHKTGKETAMGVPELKITPTQDSGKIDQLIEKLREENVIVAKGEEGEAKCALVFTQFNENEKAVVKRLEDEGVPTAHIRSGKTKANQEIERSFQAQGEGAPRVIVMNTLMGTALNLSVADSCHILDETWVPDNQEQAEDRGHRGDEITMAKDEVRMYYYRTRRSIEEYIQKLVGSKAMNNRTILDLRRRMQKAAEEKAKADAKASGE